MFCICSVALLYVTLSNMFCIYFCSSVQTLSNWASPLLQNQPPEVLYNIKKLFLKISQNSQETPVAESQAHVFSCEFCEIFKNTFSYITSLEDCFCRSVVFTTDFEYISYLLPPLVLNI